jgi:hypothetical protein
MESVEPLSSGQETMEFSGQTETETTESVETQTERSEESSEETQATPETTDHSDPEELARAEWQKEFDAAPPRVQRALIQEAERRKALEDELERRGQVMRPTQAPQADPKGQDAELRKYLVDNKKVSFEAQMRAINAQAAGNEAEYEKQLEIMALADLNIGRINEERARIATATEFNEKARPIQISAEIKSIKHFEPFHDAADEMADVHAALEHYMGSKRAYALMDRMARKIAFSTGKKTSKSKVTPIAEADKARAQKRSKSETPDGGVAAAKPKTSAANEDKANRDWIASWRGKRPAAQ